MSPMAGPGPRVRQPADRAPDLAAGLTAVAMLAIAGFWALLGLLGANGMAGTHGAWFVYGHLGSGLLALGLAPWLAAHLCRLARQRGWHAAPAAVAATGLATGVALLALSATTLVLVAATTS